MLTRTFRWIGRVVGRIRRWLAELRQPSGRTLVMPDKPVARIVNHEEWEHYNAYWKLFREFVKSHYTLLPELHGSDQEYFVRFPSGGDIWYGAAVKPITGCLFVNATFRPRTDPAFENVRQRVEAMPHHGWPLLLEWRHVNEDRKPPNHQVEMRCLADFTDQKHWVEQHRWLARHLEALWQAVANGVDPMEEITRRLAHGGSADDGGGSDG
jgi:hypothetical protein